MVGMACRFPGAPDIDAFWSLLKSGGYAIGKLPPDRFDRDLYYSAERGTIGKSYSDVGGVVAEPEMTPALTGDVAHRHVLSVVAAACRDAKLPMREPAGRRVGIYVAHLRGSALAAGLTYARSVDEFIAELRKLDLPEVLYDSIATRIADEVRAAYTPLWGHGQAAELHPAALLKLLRAATGWTGPATNVDAACASSFQALDLAVRALRCGEVETALVASASYNNWHSLVLFAQAQAVSATGSFPFDARADGFVSSDGYAAVILKPLANAIRDGLTIHGVIRGIGISSDGHGRSLWAPRREGQVAAIARAWTSDLNVADLQYVEAHGTSTQVGDATEFAALTEALGGRLPGARVPIGSVKANIGHTRESAGLAGLIKCLLAMKHRLIPPAVNFEIPNPTIDWAGSPFYIPRAAVPWPNPRFAIIDSFGIGGLNAHVIVEHHVGHRGMPSAAPSRVRREEIAIVGVGCVLPGANSFAAFRELLNTGRDARMRVPEERWGALKVESDTAVEYHGGFVTGFTYDWRRHKIPPKQFETADPLQFMVLDAADQALASHTGAMNRERTAVIVGTGFSNEFRNELNLGLHLPDFVARLNRIAAEHGATEFVEHFSERFIAHHPALLDESGSFTSSTLASKLARTYDLMGGAFALDSGECSSYSALSAAVQMLQSRECDAVLCAGAQRAMDVISYELMARYGAFLGPDPCFPGEGAAVIVLKRLSDARSNSDRIYGILEAVDADPSTNGAAPVRDALMEQIGHTIALSGLASVLKNVAGAGSGVVSLREIGGSSYRTEIRQPRIVFLFPGQGSQYSGMLRELVRTYEPAARALAECDALLVALHLPRFTELDELGKNVIHTQLAVLVADYVMLRSLEAMGIKPDVVAGYSYGDFPALIAAGCLTIEQAIRITLERCRTLEGQSGVLVAVNASSADVRGVHVAIHSAPNQIVVGGGEPEMDAFIEHAERAGWLPMRLPVPLPFHTPVLASSEAAFAQVIDSEQFLPPTVPYLSTLRARYLSDPLDIRAMLSEHLTSTVHYQETMERVVGEGPAILIEVGPRSILTNLNRRMVDGTSSVAIHTDSGLPQLRRVRALIGQHRGGDTSEDGIHHRPVLFFDATERRRSKNDSPAVEPATELQRPQNDELDRFLVRFICEQTGYPEHVVDLDADLEADLGIDSIKKAQLFGELRELYRLRIGAGEKLTLADFPNLRTIGAFVRERRRSNHDPVSILTLTGRPYDLGVQHAQRYGERIRQLIAKHEELRPGFAEVPFADAPRMLGAAGLEQLTGIADELKIPVEQLFAYNVGLCPDHLPGCSHFAAPNASSIMAGSNEDAPLVLNIGELLAPALQVHRPVDGIPYAVLAAPGRIGGINGVNARGLSITSALLLDRITASREGVIQPALVQHLLSTASSINEALDMLRSAQRSGAWSVILSQHLSDRVCHVEYDSRKFEFRDHQTSAATSNHSQILEPREAVPEHSRCRLERLRSMLNDGRIGTQAALDMLLDRHDLARGRQTSHPTMNTIRRVDHLCSMLYAPAENALWVAPRGAEAFTKIALDELFPPPVTQRYVLKRVARGTGQRNGGHYQEAFVAGQGPKAEALAQALRSRAIKVYRPSNAAIIDQLFDLQAWSPRMRNNAIVAAITDVGDIEGAGLTSLFKSIRREFPNLHAKTVETPLDMDPAQAAACFLQEIDSGATEVEVSYTSGGRHVIQGVERAVVRQSPIPRGTTWVVTGGARGITALVARELGVRYGLNLHLIGSTPLDETDSSSRQIEIRSNLNAMRRAGVRAAYHCCDIRNRARLNCVLDHVRAEGPIFGIIHGAGVEWSVAFERKVAEQVRATVDVKVTGAGNLMQATSGDALEYFVAFGSAAGRFGGPGQTDYAMASGMLAKLVGQFRADRPGCKAVTFHWPAWDGTGMAMRPGTRAMLELNQRRFMPVHEGINHVIAELEAGAPEAEVLVYDGQARDPQQAEVVLDPAGMQFLRDHRFRGVPLLPAAASVWMLLDAASAISGAKARLMRRFAIRQPLRFDGTGKKTVRVHTAAQDSGFECRITTEANRPIAEAFIEPSEPGNAQLEIAPAEYQPFRYRDEAESLRRGLPFYGPSMRCLKEIAIRPDGLSGRIIASQDRVAVLDACFVACGTIAVQALKVTPLAHGFAALLVGRQPESGQNCKLNVRYLGREEQYLYFDFILAAEDGDVIYRAERCSLVVAGAEAALD